MFRVRSTISALEMAECVERMEEATGFGLEDLVELCPEHVEALLKVKVDVGAVRREGSAPVYIKW